MGGEKKYIYIILLKDMENYQESCEWYKFYFGKLKKKENLTRVRKFR